MSKVVYLPSDFSSCLHVSVMAIDMVQYGEDSETQILTIHAIFSRACYDCWYVTRWHRVILSAGTQVTLPNLERCTDCKGLPSC